MRAAGWLDRAAGGGGSMQTFTDAPESLAAAAIPDRGPRRPLGRTFSNAADALAAAAAPDQAASGGGRAPSRNLERLASTGGTLYPADEFE